MHFLLALLLLPLALTEGIDWQQRGLDGLKLAIKEARRTDGLVLVGLAGSDR